jgi:hypothetical protein
MERTRRRMLATCSVVVLAGCSDGRSDEARTPTSTPTAAKQSRYVTDDGVVDYPGMVDGAATVDPGGDSYSITYTDPAREFTLASGFEGETAPSELRVSRQLSIDARVGFVAPIYDPDAAAFVYQVFANEAFVRYADWNVITAASDGSLAGNGDVPFERVQGDVFAAGLRPGDISRLFVVDVDVETFETEGGGSLSGIVVLVGHSEDTTPEP